MNDSYDARGGGWLFQPVHGMDHIWKGFLKKIG